MGNLGFMIPTEKEKLFTREHIFTLLINKFPKLNITNIDEWEEINIQDKMEDKIAVIYFIDDPYILDFDETPELLPLKGKPCISFTHSIYFKNQEINTEIFKFLHNYFHAYWFDEGIHPEYMDPDYKFKSKEKPTLLKHFLNFIKFYK